VLIRAEFEHEILSFHGIPLSAEGAIRVPQQPEPSHSFVDFEPGHFLDSFEIDIDGENVHLTPQPDEEVYSVPAMNDAGEQVGVALRHYRVLHSLKAELTLDVEVDNPEKLDTRPFETRARRALQLVLQALKDVTGADIKVEGLSVRSRYLDADRGRPLRSRTGVNFSGVGSLDRQSWQDVRVRAQTEADRS